MGTQDQVIYDVQLYLEKAENMLVLSPPDVVLFSELIWGAAAMCIRKFCLSNFKINIKSHGATLRLMNIVEENLHRKPSDIRILSKAFNHAKQCHKNFYDLGFLADKFRQSILASMQNMEKIMDAPIAKKLKQDVIDLLKKDLSLDKTG
ncbi:HEPN domain-containing protein [Caenorhabditis elegans]|uniref:HEPN domain-containing protein n=1 Tax=Caenorhabditis elegans TaxID=6239 RepID=B5U8N9_CAEEL|nr:HEPN domain-containing protein [Caenorhabditis elegans]CAR64659.1 HEPN domain-containing protein [Caenorhabditis elegans]|eukprot:NP_001129884.1 Uncharacterized protein CELE_C25F9.15 [Caenorhabditis elegans]